MVIGNPLNKITEFEFKQFPKTCKTTSLIPITFKGSSEANLNNSGLGFAKVFIVEKPFANPFPCTLFGPDPPVLGTPDFNKFLI